MAVFGQQRQDTAVGHGGQVLKEMALKGMPVRPVTPVSPASIKAHYLRGGATVSVVLYISAGPSEHTFE